MYLVNTWPVTKCFPVVCVHIPEHAMTFLCTCTLGFILVAFILLKYTARFSRDLFFSTITNSEYCYYKSRNPNLIFSKLLVLNAL